MVSKAEIKFIKSLQLKKNRDREGVFIIEGAKNIIELVDSNFQITRLLVTKDFYHINEAKLSKLSGVIAITSQHFIESAGTFKTNQAGLAVVSMKNPFKSTMGSFARVHIRYEPLKNILEEKSKPVYGALLDGVPINSSVNEGGGIILMGNESKGIDENLKPFISHPVTIPRIGEAESLNVAIATGILCAHFCGG